MKNIELCCKEIIMRSCSSIARERRIHKCVLATWIAFGTIYIARMGFYYLPLPWFWNTSEKYFLVETALGNDSRFSVGFPVITNVPGGIGNQLFEFACAYALAKKRNSNLYVLAPSSSENVTDHPPSERTFSLDHFKIKFSRIVQEDFLSFGSGRIFDFQEYHIWENSLPTDQVLRVNDVCVSEVYFKEYREEIKNMLTLEIDETPVKDILEKTKTLESVSVHVRRGDYTYDSENRTIPISFQKRAMKIMERMVPNATFFVFSDDLDYVRKEFQGYQNIIFVDNSKERMASILDFLVMTKCKHNIIANSTFSWWAAYLNRNKSKIVIGPLPRHPPGWNEEKYTDKMVYKYRQLIFTHYMYPNDWLTLNPYEY